MWEVCEKLLDPSKREYLDINVEDYNKYFNCAIKVCIKHATITGGVEAEQGQWFVVLQHLYEFYLKLMRSKETPSSPTKQNTRNSPLDLIGTTINNCIRKLLSVMMDHISFQKILTTITDKHGELEMENFKGIFSTMILSYIHQEKILDSAKQILQHRIVSLFEDLEKSSRKGRGIKTNACAKCKKHFVIQSENQYYSFPCGHVYHTTCLKNNNICEECTFNNNRKMSFQLIGIDNLEQLSLQANIKKEELDSEKENHEEKKEIKEEQKKKSKPGKQKLKGTTLNRKDEYIRKMRIYEKNRVKSFSVSAFFN